MKLLINMLYSLFVNIQIIVTNLLENVYVKTFVQFIQPLCIISVTSNIQIIGCIFIFLNLCVNIWALWLAPIISDDIIQAFNKMKKNYSKSNQKQNKKIKKILMKINKL